MTGNNFADTLEEFGVEVRRDYSGRGMSGKACVGCLVGTEAQARSLIIDLLTGCFDEEREELGKILRRGKIDGMGKDYIFYFPGTSIQDPAPLPPFESSEAECA